MQGLACCFDAVKGITDLFGFVYKYKTMTAEVDLKLSYDRFLATYFEQGVSSCQRKY